VNDKPPAPDAAAANTAALNAAFERLLSDLREAKARFEASKNAGRDGVLHGLRAVTQFLSHLQPVLDERLHAPLAVVCDALESLDSNLVKPILKPTSKPGPPPESELRKSIKGHAVFTARQLHKAGGIRFPQACAQVAHVLNKEDVKSKKGPITGNTIKQWAEDLSADFGRYGAAAQVHDDMEKAIGGIEANMTPTAKAHIDTAKFKKGLLDALRVQVRQLRAHEE
jgi:hypothetical protein